jgi:hypothetical protein
MAFSTLTDRQLVSASGGVQMGLGQYDGRTKRGVGIYHELVDGKSVALTEEAMRALGLTNQIVKRDHPWVDIRPQGGGGVLRRRVDDQAYSLTSRRRADVYMRGPDKLPDRADVTLSR